MNTDLTIPMGDAFVNKYLIDLPNSKKAEVCYFNRPEKQVVCFSTQLSCSVGCKFCASPGPERTVNLTTEEMLELCDETLSKHCVTDKIILFSIMGEGEPLLNYNNVIDLMHRLPQYYPNCKLALSTSGASTKRILDLADEDFSVPFKLQISMHILDQEQRKIIMPLAESVAAVMAAAAFYRAKQPNNPIELNFTLMKGINDTALDIGYIKEYLDTSWYIKLGRYNHVPNSTYFGSDKVDWFANELREAGFTVEVHASDGSKNASACGQTRGQQN